MNREEAKESIEKKAGSDIYGMMAFDLIEFLYDNGFKILKVVDAKYENREESEAEQSAFMKEWESMLTDIGRDEHEFMSHIMELIDKHKRDK